MSDLLRISPAAVDFIKGLFRRYSEEKALVVVGVVVGTVRAWDENTPIEELTEIGSKTTRDLASRITVAYQINTTDLKRLPQEDIYVVDGIKCYLPEDIRKIVGSREVVLKNGGLQFEPSLEPQEVERDTNTRA